MPGPTAPRARSSLQRRIVGAFTEQLPLKATALALALGLWFMVNDREPQSDRSVELLMPVKFTPVLDSSLVLRDTLPRIQAIIDGPPNELIKLNGVLPTIRRQITSDSPDTLVIDLTPADVTLPEGIDAVVRDISPRSVTLRFESMWTRRVPVRSAIEIAPTTRPPGPLSLHIDPISVEVSGPRHLVARVTYVMTSKTTIPFPDPLPHLVDLDTAGLGAGVRLRPAQVKVLVGLEPQHP